MKIMFLTDRFYPFRDATSSCVYELAKQLKINGNTVSILSVADDKECMKIAEVDGICTYWMHVPHRLPLKKLKEEYKSNRCEYFFTLFIKLISRFFKVGYSKLGCDKLSVFSFEKAIEKYSREMNPDYIIAAFMPTELARACYELKRKKRINSKYIVYHTDEYIENFAFDEDGRKLREKWLGEIYSKAEGVFMTPLMLERYKGYYPLESEKFSAIEFPLMTQKDTIKTTIPWNEQGGHCLYCGTFYPKIRNPQYLIRIFSRLEKENIHLHLIMAADFEIEKYGIDYLPQNVHIHSTMKQNEVFFLMQHAHALINIGNAFDNMLPSKIFDMFASGRPIIHLAQIQECTSVPYMEKYPKALIIEQYAEGKLDEHVESVKEFVMSSMHMEELNFSDISRQYMECTPEYVAKCVEEKIREI